MATPKLVALLPWPQQVEPASGSFELAHSSNVMVVGLDPDDVGTEQVVSHLVADVQRASGVHLQRSSGRPAVGDVVLRLDASLAAQHGDEGYELVVDPDQVLLRAATLHGLWNGSRTFVQLFAHRPPDATIPALRIVDRPRFQWRGAMLDVARHFFSVDHVMRFVELIARFKLNRLHLHLTDDQGWRLAIDGWPTLTGVGGSTSVGGGYGGYFSRDEYREIVAHAARHFVTIVPEVDMPGHTNAALASVPGLNVDGIAPPMYTGSEVGFSSLRLAAPATSALIRDVIAQLAADTPGEYLHIGGDEAHSTDPGEYAALIQLLQTEVHAHGKTMVGWEEIATTSLAAGAVVQHWLRPEIAAWAPPTTRFVMSPARHTYLDMKHTPDCFVGRRWAGFIDLDTIYEWDPSTLIEGVGDERILGVEAPLWTERVVTFGEVEYLTFPRLACLAEVGWSPQRSRSWPHARPRLREHTDRLSAIGVHPFHSPLLD